MGGNEESIAALPRPAPSIVGFYIEIKFKKVNGLGCFEGCYTLKQEY